jgi:putative tricarboxylic transport membrane protein
VPRSILVPNILVLCALGAYALNNTMDSVYALLLFGVLGYLLVKFGFPLAPLILGVILGDQIEINLVRSLMTDADPWLFLTRPISGTMLVLSVLSVALALWQHRRQYRRAGALPEGADGDV